MTVFWVIAIIFIVVALLGFALPKQMVHVLVALKLLKWETGEPEDAQSETSLKEAFAKLGEVPLKKLAIPFAVVLAVVVLVFGISNCHAKGSRVYCGTKVLLFPEEECGRCESPTVG